eukprot:Opistho-2@42594
MSRRREKCICLLCTCGKHHCPAPVHDAYKLEGAGSTYKTDFVPREIDYKPCKLPEQPRPDYAPFEDSTTTRSAYKRWEGGRRSEPIRPQPSQLMATPSDYVYQTTNSIDFSPKAVQVERRTRPVDYTASSEPMQKITTTGEHYRKPEVDYKLPSKRESKYSPSDAPFEGVTMYKADFYQKPIPTRSRRSEPLPDPFDDQYEQGRFNTEYNRVYTPKKSQRCPVGEMSPTEVTTRSKCVRS